MKPDIIYSDDITEKEQEYICNSFNIMGSPVIYIKKTYLYGSNSYSIEGYKLNSINDVDNCTERIPDFILFKNK